MEPISEQEARAFLRDEMVAHIGVVDGGAPYVTPMSFVLDGDRILFRTTGGRRFEAMGVNPLVCVEASHFDDETGDWLSVIATGPAHKNDDEAIRDTTLELLRAKYARSLGDPLGRSGFQSMGLLPHIVVVEIEEISGMSSGRGFSYRTRPGRL